MTPQDCDLIIRNGTIVTMDAARRVHDRGAIAVRGHSIAAVGPETEILAGWRSPHRLDAAGAIVHPGFVDAHLHVNAQTCRGYFRGDSSKGTSNGPSYADWKAELRDEDEYAATSLAAIEMLRHGITTFVEPGSAFAPDAVAAAAGAAGIRCTLADPYLWDETDMMQSIPGLLSPRLAARVAPDRARCEKLLGGQLFRNRDIDGIAHGHIALYGEGTASDALWRAAKALADREGAMLNTHIGFDIGLAEAMEARWRKPRFAYLAELGVLGPNTTFVHMNLIRDAEVDAILSSGLSMVWCPFAYGSRGLPMQRPTRLPEMKRRGIAVALGTDSARQSSAGDAVFLAFVLAGAAGMALPAEDILEMATLHGARAAGLGTLIGSLSPGMRADIVIRATGAAELWPGIDPAHQLVAVGHGANADTVVVNGRVILRHGRSTQVDEAEIFAAARASTSRVAARLGVAPASPWLAAARS
jgi:cytosine/adenosine deaminase-related metal-dependent hydrolase